MDTRTPEHIKEEEELRKLLKVMLRKEDHELLPSDIAFLKARRDYLERPDRQRVDALQNETAKPEEAKQLDDGDIEA